MFARVRACVHACACLSVLVCDNVRAHILTRAYMSVCVHACARACVRYE